MAAAKHIGVSFEGKLNFIFQRQSSSNKSKLVLDYRRPLQEMVELNCGSLVTE